MISGFGDEIPINDEDIVSKAHAVKDEVDDKNGASSVTIYKFSSPLSDMPPPPSSDVPPTLSSDPADTRKEDAITPDASQKEASNGSKAAPGAPKKKKNSSNRKPTDAPPNKRRAVARSLDEAISQAADHILDGLDRSYQLVLGHKDVVSDINKSRAVVDYLDSIKSVLESKTAGAIAAFKSSSS
jgi:hypothetical protein